MAVPEVGHIFIPISQRRKPRPSKAGELAWKVSRYVLELGRNLNQVCLSARIRSVFITS